MYNRGGALNPFSFWKGQPGLVSARTEQSFPPITTQPSRPAACSVYPVDSRWDADADDYTASSTDRDS